ncbi:hypothetical protein CC78DRAFT_431451, partial [Lojkania enalia]
VSILEVESFTLLQNCAQCYFLESSTVSGFTLRQEISCCQNPLESCFYRADLQPEAHTYFPKGVYSKCLENSINISSAVDVYDGYCATTG